MSSRSTGLLLRKLIKAPILGKPYELLYIDIPIMETSFQSRKSNPGKGLGFATWLLKDFLFPPYDFLVLIGQSGGVRT